MEALAEHLGEGVLRLIEGVLPPVARFADHSVMIGQVLMLAFVMAIVWSVSGIVRRR
jgi:hypothetical protein